MGAWTPCEQMARAQVEACQSLCASPAPTPTPEQSEWVAGPGGPGAFCQGRGWGVQDWAPPTLCLCALVLQPCCVGRGSQRGCARPSCALWLQGPAAPVQPSCGWPHRLVSGEGIHSAPQAAAHSGALLLSPLLCALPASSLPRPFLIPAPCSACSLHTTHWGSPQGPSPL